MPSVADLMAITDRIAPLAKAASWDPVGLQLGDPASPADVVALSHEVTDAVVQAVVDGGIDALVAYHPLVFSATRSFTAGAGPIGRAYRLVRAGVSLVIVHTAADVNETGCAPALATALGLGDITPFAPLWPAESAKVVTFVPSGEVEAVRAAMAGAGAGAIGRYTGCSFETAGRGSFVPGIGATPVTGLVGQLNHEDEVRLEMVAPAGRIDAVVAALTAAHPYDEAAYDVIKSRSNAGFLGRHGELESTIDDLAATVESALGVSPRVAGSGPVKRVAVIPGSGGDFIDAASAVSDVLVTGDVSHHQARRAIDRGMGVIDPGHAATERPGVASLYASLVAELGDVVDLTAMAVSPWKEG